MDQKDFGRIAVALMRQDEGSADLAAYNRLRPLVAAGEVQVYFSFVHVIEALRFGDVQSPIAVSYCEVVDTLTQGNCIRCVPHLLQAELERALADSFGYQSPHSDDYPYGRHADALITDDLAVNVDFMNDLRDSTQRKLKQFSEQVRSNVDLPSRQTIRAFLRRVPAQALEQMEAILPPGMSAHNLVEVLARGSDEEMRALAESLCTSSDFIGRMMNSMPANELDDFNRAVPAGDFRWSREHLMTVLFGTSTERETVWRRFFAGVMSFSQLVTHYSRTHPDLAAIGHSLDENEMTLVHQLRRMQQFEPLRAAILGTPATWDRDISREIGDRYLDGVRQQIRAIAAERGFEADRAERALSVDRFRRLPYIRATMIWLQSYLSRHRGSQHARNPEPNDIRDWLHCVNTPYVDVLITERFAAEVSRPLASAFGARVLRSLSDLTAQLPSESFQ